MWTKNLSRPSTVLSPKTYSKCLRPLLPPSHHLVLPMSHLHKVALLFAHEVISGYKYFGVVLVRSPLFPSLDYHLPPPTSAQLNIPNAPPPPPPPPMGAPPPPPAPPGQAAFQLPSGAPPPPPPLLPSYEAPRAAPTPPTMHHVPKVGIGCRVAYMLVLLSFAGKRAEHKK